MSSLARQLNVACRLTFSTASAPLASVSKISSHLQPNCVLSRQYSRKLQQGFQCNNKAGRNVISSISARCASHRSHRDRESRADLVWDRSTEPTLAADIYDSIIFTDEHFVAINKPRGLSVYGSLSQAQDGAHSDTQHSKTDNEHIDCVVQALPYLQDKLGCSHLEVGLSLKSYYSGLLLLCKRRDSKAKLSKCMAVAETQKKPVISYLAITMGIPQCPHNVDLVANIRREWLHDREMSIICEKDSKSARKEGTMIQTCFHVKPLLLNETVGAALVQITLNKDKWDAVEAIMSYYLSPVLGDHIYSSRTFTIMGVPFPASPHAAFPKKQRLLPTLEERLSSKIKPKDKSLPLLLHRHKLTLTGRESQSQVFTAKPREEFVRVLQCLGLNDEKLYS